VRKLLVLPLLIVGLTATALVVRRTSDESASTPDVLGAPVKEEDQDLTIDYNDQSYAVYWHQVGSIDNLELKPNFSEMGLSSDLKDQNDCSFLVNAGFYTVENEPVGLFIYEGQTIREWSKNSLFNAVISVNQFATPLITRGAPSDRLRIALQTGPFLIENAQTLSISIRNDKPARRVVAATTGDNGLLFITIFSRDSVFSGPFLADLPQITEIISSVIEIPFADAVNLDGGTASAYHSDVSLTELSPIGSYFCEKN
jgi:hypothetical protein